MAAEQDTHGHKCMYFLEGLFFKDWEIRLRVVRDCCFKPCKNILEKFFGTSWRWIWHPSSQTSLECLGCISFG